MKINSKITEALIAHGRKSLPAEACGYLGGTDDMISYHIELTNADNSPEHFSMVPKEQFEAVRTIRGMGLKVLGIYHSHPATPARPSFEDIKLAFDPTLSYLIVSLATIPAVVKSFKIVNGLVSEEQLIIQP